MKVEKLYWSVLTVLLAVSLPAMASVSHYMVRHYSVEDGLSQNTVSCILQDAEGYMWFGTWNGLNRFDGYKFVVSRPDSVDGGILYSNRIDALRLVNGKVQPTAPVQGDSIYVDKHGVIWKVDDRQGILRYRDGAWKRFCPPLDPRYVGQLRRNFFVLEDHSGALWVNPTGGGFSRYNYEEDTLEWPFHDLTNMVHTAYIDRQGLLWLSTYDGGLDCVNLSMQPFNLQDLRTDKDPVGEVRAMMSDGNDLHIYQRDYRMVYCAVQTSYGLLLGTKGHGIIGLPFDCDCPDVYSILEVGEKLYVGTYGNGVVTYTGGQRAGYGAGLKVRDLLYADSTVWAATTSGLLVGDSLIDFYDVRCLLQDRKGRIWCGTFGGGLYQVVSDAKGVQLIRQNTYSTIVMALVEDAQGNIWYTGETDITCYQPEQGTFQRYKVFNGETGACFNEAKALSMGEEVVFGYNHGYCRFRPSDIHQSSFVPPLMVTEIEYRNRSSVSVAFAALDYAAPSKILYSWQLSGVDEDWVEPTPERKAYYTNLKPGKYIFQLRSTNSEGVWVDNVRQVIVTIERAFWQSGWMVLIILLVLGIIGWVVARLLKATNALKQEVAVEQKVTDIKLRFFTNISHELRTPLTLISGPVDNLLTKENLSPAVREQLEIVSGNARRMLRMINMLLDFRKLQQNQLKMKVSPIHFWSLVEDTCNNFNKEAQKKSITFQKQLLTGDDLVWVDHEKMETVLFNLLSNAFKYTPEGGTVTVQLTDKDDFILLSVRDTGCGIPKEKRSVLFERFRSNNELNGTGTGIGLNLTKELVDMHHAYIEVASEVGKGSVFTVLIRKGNEHFGTEVEIVVDDAVPATAKVKAGSHRWVVQEHKPLMLIVDDNEDMRSFIESIFSDLFTIHTAADGIEALEMIHQTMPQVVLSDLMMPNMDGIELLKRLRQSEATASLPIILLTAKTAIESQLEGLEHGADDYITKPFSPAYIKARVLNLLQQRDNLKHHYHKQLISMNTHKQEKTPDDLFLARLMAFMDQQMDNNNLSVDEMVEYMNMGRTVFFNRLKQLTGLSPVEFIREVRIKRAVQLLEMKSYNITEITYMVGMSDSRYFSKCFKQVLGVTPSEYRRNLTNAK